MLVYRKPYAVCCIDPSRDATFSASPREMGIVEIGATFAFDPRSYVWSMTDR